VNTNDYVIRVFDDPSKIPAQAWDALLAQSSHPTPFMQHAYLAALHASGSAIPATGWLPQFVTLWDPNSNTLRAACPLYVKSHSYGEYVFDWSWAQAYEQHGLEYYPKAVIAIPFTPVPGSRLLAITPADRMQLMQAVQDTASAQAWSSVHLLFASDEDRHTCKQAEWLERQGVQFHFQNCDSNGQPYGSFDDLLARMQQDKRKKIRQERRKVSDAGVHCVVRQGMKIAPEDWAFFYRCYERTYLEHGNLPYLKPDFFERMRLSMPEHWMMVIAQTEDGPIASSLIALDPSHKTAFGRYWGALQHVDCLHFEVCYYQPLMWCIEQGYLRFEGGAQGEHKMARALLPTPTASAHWIAHPDFRSAIARFLQREQQGISAYQQELNKHSPLKTSSTATPLRV
jgi:predicted N-acyltransferase